MRGVRHVTRAGRRSRTILWVGVIAIIGVTLWAGALIGTSTRWFCEEPCHIVHADNTKSYNAASHAKISCIACHEPVNASPFVYTYMKIYVLPDLWATITKTFDLPMNPNNEVALAMPAGQCTQCHDLSTRPVTTTTGLKIDHQTHSDRGIQCTLCHNRVAHDDEAVEYTLPGDTKHADWMKMDGCFRCHGQAPDAKAPGTCSACHTPKFNLVPASHEAPNWYTQYGDSAGHGKAAKLESATIAAARRHVEKAETEEDQDAEPTLPPMQTINSCYTCHKQSFCDDCHGGIVLPHTEQFKRNHGKVGYAEPEKCGKCHAGSAQEAKSGSFCDTCHHPASVAGTPWLNRHPVAVKAGGAQACFECHAETQCSYCHVNGVAAGRAQLVEAFAR